MKKIITIFAVLGMALSLVACGGNDAVVEDFDVQYEVTGTTHSGAPKTDLWLFQGKTTDGKITELNFDIIANKGTDKEISKKDIMGYLMNVADCKISNDGNGGFKLEAFNANGFVNDMQFMINGSVENLTEETTFADVTFSSYMPISLDFALAAYSSLAKEAGIENLTAETKLVDILPVFGLYADGAFTEGFKRVAFDGPNGGRSYGEQIDAITKYIVDNGLTLEEVYEMFKNENKMSDPMSERDLISGATIAFGGDFEKMAYIAAFGEAKQEGVTGSTNNEDGTTTYTVVTSGYAGDVTTNVTFDADGKIVTISASGSETEGVGAALYAEGSEFLASLVEGKSDVKSGATITSNALISAVELAKAELNK